MKKIGFAAIAVWIAACGSVDENRHLDGGTGDSTGSASADAAPTGPAMLTMTQLTHEFGPVDQRNVGGVQGDVHEHGW